MDVGVGGDLRQVGHAQDLVAPGERPQAPPDRIRAPAADPAVDLVEDERRRGVGRGQHLLDRQRDPATARRPTRSGPAAGPARRGSGRTGTRPRRSPLASNATASPSISTAGSSGPAGRRPSADVEDGPAGSRARRAPPRRHPQACRPRRPGAPTAPPAVAADLGQQRGRPRRAAGPARPRGRAAVGLGGLALAVGDDGRLVVAVAPLEGVDQRQALLEPGESAGSWSTSLDQRRGPRRRRPRAPPRGPPAASARASKRGSKRASARGAVGGRRRAPTASPRPAPPSPRRAAPRAIGPPPRAIASPWRAAPSRARDLLGLADPEARGVDLGRLVLGSSSRRPTSRGSTTSSASAARFARQRSTASATAVAGRRRSRRTRRADRAAPARRGAAAGRAGRGSRRAAPTVSASRAAVTVSSSSRAVDRPPAPTSRTAISGSGSRSNSASTRATSGAVADERRCRPARRGRARARRSAGSCRRRSRR